MTVEQRVRDMLERAGVFEAQYMTAGSLVELANIVAEWTFLRRALDMKQGEQFCGALDLYGVDTCLRAKHNGGVTSGTAHRGIRRSWYDDATTGTTQPDASSNG